MQFAPFNKNVSFSRRTKMGSTLRRLKIYYMNNFKVTRHGLWLIVGISVLLMISSSLFDYRPTAFYEVCLVLGIAFRFGS